MKHARGCLSLALVALLGACTDREGAQLDQRVAQLEGELAEVRARLDESESAVRRRARRRMKARRRSIR